MVNNNNTSSANLGFGHVCVGEKGYLPLDMSTRALAALVTRDGCGSAGKYRSGLIDHLHIFSLVRSRTTCLAKIDLDGVDVGNVKRETIGTCIVDMDGAVSQWPISNDTFRYAACVVVSPLDRDWHEASALGRLRELEVSTITPTIKILLLSWPPTPINESPAASRQCTSSHHISPPRISPFP